MSNSFPKKYLSEYNKYLVALRDLRSFLRNYKNTNPKWDNNDLTHQMKKVQREVERLEGMMLQLERNQRREKRAKNANL